MQIAQVNMASPMILKMDLGDSPGDRRGGPRTLLGLNTPREIAMAIATEAVIGNQRSFDIPESRSKTFQLS